MPIEAYNEQEELEVIRRRYAHIPKSIQYTLERLQSSDDFANVVRILRQDGWKDWHILLAIYNVVFNWHVQLQRGNSDLARFEKK